MTRYSSSKLLSEKYYIPYDTYHAMCYEHTSVEIYTVLPFSFTHLPTRFFILSHSLVTILTPIPMGGFIPHTKQLSDPSGMLYNLIQI